MVRGEPTVPDTSEIPRTASTLWTNPLRRWVTRRWRQEITRVMLQSREWFPRHYANKVGRWPGQTRIFYSTVRNGLPSHEILGPFRKIPNWDNLHVRLQRYTNTVVCSLIIVSGLSRLSQRILWIAVFTPMQRYSVMAELFDQRSGSGFPFSFPRRGALIGINLECRRWCIQ